MPTVAPKALRPKNRYSVSAVRKPRKFSLAKSTSAGELPDAVELQFHGAAGRAPQHPGPS